MCDSISESLKLNQQDRAKLIFYILRYTKKLHELFKCYICFEQFDKPIKTNCGHVFCKGCLYKHTTYYTAETITPCPICMGPLDEFKKFPVHLEYERGVKLIKEILGHSKHFHTDIEEPAKFNLILKKILQNASEQEVELGNEMANFQSDSRYKSILNSRKFVVLPNSQVFLNESADAILSNEARIDDVNAIPRIGNLQTEANAFDLLVNESIRLKPTKTYKPPKKPQKDVIVTEIEKAIKTKKRLGNSKALEWLRDTRNNFETSPTQLEGTKNLKEVIPKFDLPSISQHLNFDYNSKPNKMDQIKTKRLTRSMSISSKVIQAKTRQRHSIAICDNLNVPIEQFTSDELKTYTKGLQDLELQCLNNIDKEMLQGKSSKRTTKLSKFGKKKKGSSSNLSKVIKKGKDTSNASSLNKFKEIKKITSKTERKLKQLPIVGNPSVKLCKVVTSAASVKNVIDEPVVIIEKSNLMNDQPVASGSKQKIDNINVPDNETYNLAKPLNTALTRVDYVNKSDNLENPSGYRTRNRRFSVQEKSKSTPGLKIKSKIKDADSSVTIGMEVKNSNILTEETKTCLKNKSSKIKDVDSSATKGMEAEITNILTGQTKTGLKNKSSNIKDVDSSAAKGMEAEITNILTGQMKTGLTNKSSKIKDIDSSATKGMEAENTNILTEKTKEIEKSVRNDEEGHDTDCSASVFDKLTQRIEETVEKVNSPNSDFKDDIFYMPTQALFKEAFEVTKHCDKPHQQSEELDLPQQLNEGLKRLSNTVGLLLHYYPQLEPKAKEYVGHFITDTLEAITTSIRLDQAISNRVNDIFVQTNSPVRHIANMVDLAIQTDPTIPSFENNLVEIGIQTDSNNSRRGLYISSTDMFNTPTLVDIEIQTDFLPCSNCNHQMITSVAKSPARLILSESFDNIQFETQDFIKGKPNLELRLQSRASPCNKKPDIENQTSPSCEPTKRTSKRLRMQNSPEELFAKDDGFDNVQFDTQEILKGKVQCASFTKNCDLESSASSSKSPRRTSKRICKLNLTDQLLEKDDGFDNIQFIKTQDLVKGKDNLKVQSPTASCESPRRTSKRLRKLSSAIDKNVVIEDVRNQRKLKEHSQPGTPSSASSKKCNVESPNCNTPRRTSKRLRTSNTPDEELLPKDIKRNKYINEDASLWFLSEETENSNHPIEFNDSDCSKYEECLNNVLKKYEDASESSKKISQKISKTQTAIQECNVIINEACSEAIDIENTENLDKTVKYVKQGPSPLTLSILQNEFTKDFDNTGKIVKTSEIPKEILQSVKVDSIETQVSSKFGDNFEEINMLLENLANGTSGSTNIETLPKNAGEGHSKLSNRGNIVVLQNIAIPTEIDVAKTKELNQSDDVFLSDTDDVVETTPQKNIIVTCEELLSQAYYCPVVPPVFPPFVEEYPDVISSLDPPLLSCFNQTFAPPPEFQDVANLEDIDNLEESQDVTLKPESDNVQVVHDSRPMLSSITPDLFMEAGNMITSTPAEHSQIISHSLNLSPIKPSYQEPFKLQNPIAAAENSMMSPLNVVKSQKKTQAKSARPLGSSTPKQKTLFSFIRNKKPCVTCTRLNTSEIAVIRTLAEKNLITYSANFNSSVTHLIISIDDQQCIIDHTMKYISAVSAGIWIVGFNWIQECLLRDQIVPEEQFEALDMTGIDGPKQSRLSRTSNPLFRGFKIYISPPFETIIQKDMEDVIINLGGEVVQNLNDLLKKNGKICIIISEAKSSKYLDMFNSWLEKLKVITVELEWLSRSVGQYEIVNFRHFVLCSNDTISDLGYPPELTSNLPVNSRSAFSNM